MLNPRLAHRYAKALLDLAVEKNRLEQVFADMQWLQGVCKASKDFVNLMRSPIIKADKKKKIIEAVAKPHLSEMTFGFIRLLTSKGREYFLPEILNSFVVLYKKHKNINTVTLTTAVPVSESVKTAIIAQVKKAANIENIELEEKVNPDIIGGFVLELGDKMVDASIAYDLREIAKQFKNNDFVFRVR